MGLENALGLSEREFRMEALRYWVWRKGRGKGEISVVGRIAVDVCRRRLHDRRDMIPTFDSCCGL